MRPGCREALLAIIIMAAIILFFVLVAKYCWFRPVAEMPWICL